MQLVKISLLCLLSLSLAGVVVAQTAVDPNADVGSASLQNFSGGATLQGTYFDVRHQASSGVGYQNGFTQIGGFTPFWLNEDAFIAPNARLLLTDNSRVGVNAGLVARQYDSARDRIFGVNGYFDSDETNFGNRYQQGTLGVETLGTNWDFRANGYFTLGTTDRFLNAICVGGNPFFAGNQIAFLGQQLREQSLSGGDFEFGVPVLPSTPWLRAYAGMYGYQSKQDTFLGVRGRLEAWISDDTSVGVIVTDDKLFGTNVNAVVDFRFSGFKPTRYFPQWATRERMLMPVQRNWRVSTHTYVQNVNIAAINPANGQPYFVSHINNTAAAGGNGSIEHPFNTLPASVPGANLILVAAGSTTEAAPLIGSITLENNQRLLGEGKAHTANMFATYGGCVVNGNFVLPGFTNSGNYPFLSSAGNIITLANNNEVSAFNLLNAGGAAITNTPAGSNNFLLQCLEISGNLGGGINLTQATGNGIIRGINLNSGSTNHLNPFGLGNNAAGGIFVDTGAAGLNLTMTNVAMNANPGSQLFGVNLQADNGPLTTTLTNVQANGVVPGFGNTAAGIILGETGQALTATLLNVSASNNTGDGLQVTGTGGGTILATITDSGSIFNGNGGSGIVYRQSGGTGTVGMTNIQANNNGVDGLGLFGSAATVMNANVHNSFLTGNTRDGIHVEEIGGATINLLVDPTNVSGNTRDGLFFDVAGASTLNATFVGTALLNTNLSDNGRNALHGMETTGSTVNLSLTDTSANRSGQDGFFFDVNASTLNVVALRSSFSGSGQGLLTGSGILGNITNGGLATFGTATIGGLTGFTDTPISNNLDHGMFVTATGLSNFQGTFTNSPFNDNGNITAGDGIRLDLDNSPNSSLSLLGTTTVNRNGNNGFELNANNGTVFTSTFTGTQIVDNGQDAGAPGRNGVQVNVDAVAGADSTVTQTFTNVTLTNTVLPRTQLDGYAFTVGNGGHLTSTFTGGSLANNLSNATDGLVTGVGSTAAVSLSGVAANLSGDAGAFLRVAAGGQLDFTATNGTSFSNNGLVGIDGNSGIDALVTGLGSVANFQLGGALPLLTTQAFLNNNAGHGFLGVAQNQGTLNACILQTSLQTNGLNGINLNIQGAGAALPSTGNVHIANSTVNNNRHEGLLANATNGGQLNYRSVGTTYNTSGVGGVFDGVQVNADGPGTRMLTLFSGGSSNNNTGDGYEFNATNGARLTASLDGTTATGNAGFGVNFNASGAATNANLLMTGNNILTGNTAGPLNINVGAINQVVLSLSGTYNNSPGDGIFINLNGVTNAVVAIQGPGTIDNSGQAPVATPSGNGDGIDVRMTNITNGSILISGLTSINTSAADGIHLEMNTVMNGAIRIDGTTTGNNMTVGGSGGDGIDISLVNTNLVNNLNTTLGAVPIDVLTLASNRAVPLNNCLPLPVTTSLNTLGLVPAQALTINNVTLSGNAGQGINIHSPNTSNSTIATATLSNNVVVNSAGGDGVHFGLFNTPVTTLNITGNQVGNSRDNGVNFGLNNSPIGTLNISNNQIGRVAGGGGSPLSDSLPLILPGFNANTLGPIDDFPSSPATALGFAANFFGTTYNNVFVNNNGNVTFNAPLSTFTPFSLLTTATPIIAPFFADVDTRSGNTVTYGTGIVGGRPAFGVNWLGVRHFSAAGGGANGLPDNTFQLVMVDRGDTGVGNFDFEFNHQQIQWESGTASGGNALGLGGFSARAGYSNGVATSLELPGSAVNGALLDTGPAATSLVQNSLNSIHPGRYIFFARGGGIGGSSPNGADGILLNAQNGSNIGAMTVDSNTITTNGLNGIEVVANNSTLPGPGAPAIISNNTITGQVAGDGFRMINPNTGVNPIGLTFRDNTISTNGGSGINVQLNNAQVANVNITSVTTGNQISGNAGFGVHLDGQNTAQINLTMGGAGAANVLDLNHDAGVGISLTNATTGSIAVANSTFSRTINGPDANFNGGGFEVRLADTAAVTPFTIGDAVLKNVTFSNNAANGFSLLLNDNSTASNLLIQNISSLQNAQNQVRIDRHANALVNVTMNDSTLTGSATSLDGFSYNATNFATATPLAINLNRNTISTNRDGIAIDTSANADVVANIVTNTISNNRNSGIRVTTLNASSFGDPSNGTASQLLGNTITGNGSADGAAGIRLIASDVSFQNVLIGASAGGTRTTLTGNFDGIRISDTSLTNPLSPPDNNFQIQATDIINSTDDGIQLDLAGAGTRVYIGNPTAAATAARNDVVITRSVPAPGGTGHGINLNATAGPNNVSIRNATIAYSGLSGVNVAQTGGDLTFNMQATQVLFSGERGLFANITNNSGATGNNYNIGGTGANEGVLIQNSGQQGILFRTQSPISSSQLRDLGVNNYGGAEQNDPNSPTIIRARLNLVNSRIIANGTIGNVNSDGVVLAVGTNTRQDVLMAGNAINGNVLDDLRIFSFASQNTQNDSVDNATTAPPTTPPHDFLRLDPIARLGLVFGSIQSTYDSTTVPPITNPQTTPLIPQGLFPSQTPNPIVLATRNTGEQINVTTTGSAATAGIANSNGTFTTNGVFTNAGRPTAMNGRVQIAQFPGPGLSDTSTFADSRNQFVQFGVEQDLDGAFFVGGFTLNPANVFP